MVSKVFLAILFFLISVPSVHAWELAWDYTPNVEDGFRLYRKKPNETVFTLLISPVKTARSHTDPDNTIGSCYQLSAYNSVGESAKIEACALVPNSIQVLILR